MSAAKTFFHRAFIVDLYEVTYHGAIYKTQLQPVSLVSWLTSAPGDFPTRGFPTVPPCMCNIRRVVNTSAETWTEIHVHGGFFIFKIIIGAWESAVYTVLTKLRQEGQEILKLNLLTHVTSSVFWDFSFYFYFCFCVCV